MTFSCFEGPQGAGMSLNSAYLRGLEKKKEKKKKVKKEKRV